MPSLGIKNKNYLNLKQVSPPWLDADGKDSRRDARGHAIFTEAAYGVRAGIVLLRSYYFKHQRRTIAEILERWAPTTDTIGSLRGAPPNSPKEYSEFVSARMNFGYNDRLEIFNADKSIGNVRRLRELFFAMAAFEIGGDFKVPLKDFNEGLELVQPGIKTDGTDTQQTNTDLTLNLGKVTGAATWKIGASVGRQDRGAVNVIADVETVQAMLRGVGMILREPALDPGAIDGRIARTAEKSTTVQAIEAFQSRFLMRPDGLIEVEGRTWRELLRVLTSGESESPGDFFFPFTTVPSPDWNSAPRSFAASRDGGARAHAGCDLYFPEGTVIHAITAGTVVRGPEPFYAGTDAIEIDHGTFLARYGEVQGSALVRKGDRVTAGQPIAKVGHLVGISVPSDMLHLELYDKSAAGPLTVAASESAKTASGVPFLRRKDLIDPTTKLNTWKTNLPKTKPGPVATPTGIPSKGFCIHLKRLRQELRRSVGYARTVGDYQCFWDGAALAGLAGQMVERGGPGDNTTEVGNNRDLRVRKGIYPLAIQDGTRYKTFRYDTANTGTAGSPKPGLLLEDTDERTAILIHPGTNYVSSIGCLNPATGLTDEDSKIDFADSRTRVIAILETMQAKMGPRFPRSGTIPDAVIILEGEPS